MVLASVFLVVVTATATLISATPLKGSSRPDAKRDLVKKHAHVEVPRDWEMLDIPIEDHHTISLQIGLKQANFDGLVKELYEVSDPAHPRYGKHLSQA